MAKILDPSKSRQVLEPITTLSLTTLPLPSSSTSITAVAITTIPDSQTLIHIGTDSGSLILLSLNTSSIEFIRQVRVSGNGVREVSVVGGIGVVVVVSDGGGLYLADLMLTGGVEKVGFSKGVSAVATRAGKLGKLGVLGGENGGGMRWRILRRLGGGGVGRSNVVEAREVEVDGEENDCVFAVACGKKLILIEVGRSQIGDGSCRVLKEILCIESVTALVWIDDSIIVGSDTGYSVVSCITGESRLIFSLPDGSSDPYVKLLVKSHKVLLLVDNVGVVVDAYGQPVSGSLVFSRVPDSVGEVSLYVVAARDGKMELYYRKSGTFVQGLSIGGSGVGRCVIADDVHGRFVAVATPSKVTCYREISHEEQIKDLLRKKNFIEAVSLVEDLEREGYMSKEMTSFVHAQVGFLLLFDLQFEKAVDHFLLSETMQPSEIFPFIMRDPNRWSLLVPRNRYWGLHPPPSHIEDVVEDGLLAIQRAIFLRKAGVETPIDEKFLLNTTSRSDLLELAFKSIVRYLQVSRDKDLSLPVREGVDTLIMYLYRSLNYIDDMEKLASSENSC
ncbi:Vacuolar sorting protein 3-like protein, partial [Drosera capensis]